MGRRKKKGPNPGQLQSQAIKKRKSGDAGLNFGRARFLSGGKHDYNSRGTSIGVVAGKDTQLSDHMRIFEEVSMWIIINPSNLVACFSVGFICRCRVAIAHRHTALAWHPLMHSR